MHIDEVRRDCLDSAHSMAPFPCRTVRTASTSIPSGDKNKACICDGFFQEKSSPLFFLRGFGRDGVYGAKC